MVVEVVRAGFRAAEGYVMPEFQRDKLLTYFIGNKGYITAGPWSHVSTVGDFHLYECDAHRAA